MTMGMFTNATHCTLKIGKKELIRKMGTMGRAEWGPRLSGVRGAPQLPNTVDRASRTLASSQDTR